MQQVTLSLLVGVVVASEAPHIRRNSGAFLRVQNDLTTAHVDVPATDVPMPVVGHEKEAGGGYAKGSPLYNKQQRWLKKNEQLVKGDLKKAKPRAAEKESEEPDLQKDAMKVMTGKMGAYDYYYRYPKTTISSLLCYILITVLVGYIYHSNFRAGLGMRKYQPYEGDSFSYNLLDCRNCRTDMPICCMAWCCPVVRWAATVSTDKVPLIGFWAALFVCLFLTGFSSFTFGITGILWLCVAVHYRQSLREYFGHGRYLESPSLVFLDCLTWVCCPCCAIVQEAREVEKAQPVLMVQPIGAPTGQAPGMTTSAQAPGTMQPSLRAGSQH